MANDDAIHVFGARERNLKNISVDIPKKQITVFTGVSGSGKSSLVFDTIAAESQRQLNENYSSFIRHRLPHYGQPDMDAIENLPVAFVINQKRIGGNSRSTVGTVTDIYSLLRLLYSRIGTPFVGYAEAFSFNNLKGMCEHCNGVGTVETIPVNRLLDKEKSLLEGAIRFPTFEPGGWRLKRYVHSGLFDNNKKLKEFGPEEMEWLLYKKDIKLAHPDPEWPKTSLYEGLILRIERSFLRGESPERSRHSKKIEAIVSREICPVCKGSRLNATILSCMINGNNIGDCTAMQADDLLCFVQALKHPVGKPIIDSLTVQLRQMVAIGLGYLHLNRETSSLSGGESQRVKMLRQLGSSLTDVAYILDEPSIGLHPYNVDKVNVLLRELRDKGNTVLVVEYDPDIIHSADHVIDMGPGSGSSGGNIVFQGSYGELTRADTVTARFLKKPLRLKNKLRKGRGSLVIENAALHNLRHINVAIPRQVLTVVTGVAGSGKSSLINGVLPECYPECIVIDQKPVHASKRSNIATYTGMFDEIRQRFAKASGVSPALFSFNAKGACPVCKGLGVLYTDLAFMDTVATPCEACEGKRYTPEVLQYTVEGKTIADVLELTVSEAGAFFSETGLSSVLQRLDNVGLGYVTLGQALDSLSGGELQRVKLAAELENNGQIYVLDEPTTGLHMADIERLMRILNRLVDQGNTVIVIEHNIDVIVQADWIIDLGPGAGQEGGTILFEGLPEALMESPVSVTGRYLKQHMQQRNVHDAQKNA